MQTVMYEVIIDALPMVVHREGNTAEMRNASGFLQSFRDALENR